MGGGLLRSAGGWAAVRELRRGREGYAADERILGGTEFVEALLREKEQEESRRARAQWQKLGLARLVEKVARIGKITPEALLGGGRRRDVSHARDGLAYLWVGVLGRSGREVAQELRIRPESIYKGARRGEKEQQRWRRALGV